MNRNIIFLITITAGWTTTTTSFVLKKVLNFLQINVRAGLGYGYTFSGIPFHSWSNPVPCPVLQWRVGECGEMGLHFWIDLLSIKKYIQGIWKNWKVLMSSSFWAGNDKTYWRTDDWVMWPIHLWTLHTDLIIGPVLFVCLKKARTHSSFPSTYKYRPEVDGTWVGSFISVYLTGSAFKTRNNNNRLHVVIPCSSTTTRCQLVCHSVAIVPLYYEAPFTPPPPSSATHNNLLTIGLYNVGNYN